MKTYRFPATPDAEGGIPVPSEVAKELPRNRQVDVVVVVKDDDEAEEDRAWRRLGMEKFLAGYAESDAIYDESP